MCELGLSWFIFVNLLYFYYCVYINTSFFIFSILYSKAEEGETTFS